MEMFAYYQSGVLAILFWVLVIVKMWALVDAVVRPAQAYLAADKLTKAAWLWILGLTMVTQIVWSHPLGIFSLAGAVAAFVYILDVRPALASVSRRR